MGKYVNMTDLNIPTELDRPAAALAAGPRGDADPQALALIELLFFAYRDFVGEADDVLARYGFGRAHHRVLHFVSRNPGMTVAELLAILKITKQSLGRVLRDLVAQKFIDSRAGERDRRQRLLYATARGERLAQELNVLQARRIGRALERIGPERADTVAAFLFAMVKADDGPLVATLVGNTGSSSGEA
jgi:DNA-binding MarR family transcriptional regulator